MEKHLQERTVDTLFFAKKIYTKNKEFEKLKGENFNIFNILDMREDEVNTHSAFIAELLNPRGSHNMKSAFLNLFIELLKRKSEEDISWVNASILFEDDYKNTIVEKEKHIGKKIDENGGRLDIILSFTKMKICIENKINADETDNQLTRYRNYLKDYPRQSNLLIFLTKYGEKSKDEKISEGKDYFTLSYKNDILNWLNQCHLYSANYPIVRETIKQYIVLVKSITNQTNSIEMKEDIYNLIYSNIIGAEIISKEYDNAIERLSDKFKEDIKNKLVTENVILDREKISLKKSSEKFSSIWITTENKEKIGIESFNGKGHENGALFIGLVDFNRSPRKENYKYYWWIGNSIEIIWDRETLLQKLQTYVNSDEGNKNLILNEVVSKVKEFVAKY
jgi:hypothetical protein